MAYEMNNPGYKNSEHYYSEEGSRPIVYRQSTEPGYKNSEHYYSEEGSRPIVYRESTEPGYKSSEHYYSEEGSRPVIYRESSEPGYKSSEHYFSEGMIFGLGPNINGKTPEELLSQGDLTPATIKDEEKKVVYDDIMMGVTNNKNLLAQKLDLVLTDEEIINRIVANQYMLAVSEMGKEQKGYVDNSPTDRKFQFLATVKILLENGINLNEIKLPQQENKVMDLAQLLTEFRKQCNQYKAKSINDPSWFKTGQPPKDYDMRKVNNPWLFAGVLITDIYKKNPLLFVEKYENYKATTNLEPMSYEEFMYYNYGIQGLTNTNDLEAFKKARAEQINSDKNLRNSQLEQMMSYQQKEGKGQKL